jgi:YegS/Rv2252/BmrU family lipid kinase
VKTCFIINPVSGKRAIRSGRIDQVEAIARRLDVDFEIRTTQARLHAIELARRAVEEGFSRVVSVGGDGTINEVATGLLHTGVALGLVPAGSGNGLARDLGLPLEFERAVEEAVVGPERTIDSGQVNGRPFFNVMGLGYDAELGQRFNASRYRGFVNYLWIGVKTYFQYRRRVCRVETRKGEIIELKPFLLAVANSTQYGGGARIAPNARLDDGLLDLSAITRADPIAVPGILNRLFTGSLDRSRRVVSLVSDRFLITRTAAGPVHTDGEVHRMDRDLRVEVVPASIKVVVSREPGSG